MSLLEWAFNEDVPNAEKLVLVWLAMHANAVGVGYFDREALAQATGYKPRSIQRLLKSLRDSGHLQEFGPWYALDFTRPEYAPLFSELDAQLAEIPEEWRPVAPGSPWLKPGDLKFGPGTVLPVPPVIDSEDLAQTVGDYLIDQLANFEHRIGQRFDQLAMFHVEHAEEVVVAPPDPVKLNPLYQELLDLGKSEAVAYALSEADLDIEGETEPADTVPTSEDYHDSPEGRLSRISDILEGASGTITQADLNAWRRLEDKENAHSVAGEASAFSQLYPAIVESAKGHAGSMSLAEFLEPAKILHGAAPWDQEIAPTDKNDPVLQAEISAMIAELNAAGDPRCQVQPRTAETGDDGVKRTETLLAYHRRVKAKHNQMLDMQDKGML